jgi:hypothetical protein
MKATKAAKIESTDRFIFFAIEMKEMTFAEASEYRARQIARIEAEESEGASN